jgi:hypothetical protein
MLPLPAIGKGIGRDIQNTHDLHSMKIELEAPTGKVIGHE